METKCKHEWRSLMYREKALGRLAFRSAGSHSPIDVVSIDSYFKRIRLIQCKTGKMSDLAKLKIAKENEELNGVFRVEFIVE